MNLRLGIAPGRTFPGGWREMVEFCFRAGFAGVEFKHELPFILPERLPRKVIKALACARREHNLTYSVHGPYVNIGSPLAYRWWAAVEEHLRALDVAQELGAVTYTIHPGFLEAKYATPDLLARGRELTARAIREILRHAGDITLCLENQNPAEEGKAKCAASPGALQQVLDVAGDAVKITWDVGHANLLPGGIKAFLEGLGLERVAVVHLHDNDGTQDSHEPPGSGTVPWEDVLRALFRDANAPLLYLELGSEQDFLQGRDFLHSLVAEPHRDFR